MLSKFISKWSKPELIGSGRLKDYILERSKVLHEEYRPPVACLNPGMQFFIRTKYEKAPTLKVHKDTLTLSDNGVIAFDRIASPTEEVSPGDSSEYVVLLTPGIRETTHSTKILRMAHDLISVGYDAIHVMNYRGNCSIPLKSKLMSHACEGHNDVSACVDELISRYGERKILLVGACAGAQCIVDYLATPHAAQTAAVVGGVIHSCMWKLTRENMDVSSGISYHLFTKKFLTDIYHKMFSYSTEEERQLKEEWFGECGIVKEELMKLKTIYEFDDYVFSRVYGWSGADEYHMKTSPYHKVPDVCKPLIWINSRDDFLARYEYFDMDVIRSNPNIALWSTAAGGHVCFVDNLFPVTSYLSKVVPECAQLLCQYVEDGCA